LIVVFMISQYIYTAIPLESSNEPSYCPYAFNVRKHTHKVARASFWEFNCVGFN